MNAHVHELINHQMTMLHYAEIDARARPATDFDIRLGVTRESVLAAIRATRQELQQAREVIK